jgi:hypothetical protein
LYDVISSCTRLLADVTACTDRDRCYGVLLLAASTVAAILPCRIIILLILLILALHSSFAPHPWQVVPFESPQCMVHQWTSRTPGDEAPSFTRNDSEALQLLESAAERAHPKAQFNLARKLLAGEGVEKNEHRARTLLMQAADAGERKVRAPIGGSKWS